MQYVGMRRETVGEVSEGQGRLFYWACASSEIVTPFMNHFAYWFTKEEINFDYWYTTIRKAVVWHCFWLNYILLVRVVNYPLWPIGRILPD